MPVQNGVRWWHSLSSKHQIFLLFQKHTLIEYRFGNGVGVDTAHSEAQLLLATPDKVTDFYNNSSCARCAKQNFITILGHCSQSCICFLQILLLLVWYTIQQYCRIALWAPHEVDRLNISGGSSSNANGSCCRNACSQVPELWKAYRAGIHRIVVFSILMTRLPGISLINSGDPFDPDIEGPWIHELKLCLDSMRQWRISPPYDQNCICSVFGTAIRRSTRVPNHTMGPFPSEKEFTQYLLSTASDHGFQSRVEYDEVWVRAERIDQRPHRVTFIQGDFRAHNILVDDDGHLSGFLDWGVGGLVP